MLFNTETRIKKRLKNLNLGLRKQLYRNIAI